MPQEKKNQLWSRAWHTRDASFNHLRGPKSVMPSRYKSPSLPFPRLPYLSNPLRICWADRTQQTRCAEKGRTIPLPHSSFPSWNNHELRRGEDLILSRFRYFPGWDISRTETRLFIFSLNNQRILIFWECWEKLRSYGLNSQFHPQGSLRAKGRSQLWNKV